MDSKDLDLLEKAFAAEIEAALNKNALYMMQTKATERADALVADGMLRHVSETLGGRYTVAGYALTELGRLTYCMSERCNDEPVCPCCAGDGMDPMTDYALPCPECGGREC